MAISLYNLIAPSTKLIPIAAPVPSPKRISRSSNGRTPIFASMMRCAFSAEQWEKNSALLIPRIVIDTDAANEPPKLTITKVGSDVFRVRVHDSDHDQVTCTATQPFCGTMSDPTVQLLEKTCSSV